MKIQSSQVPHPIFTAADSKYAGNLRLYQRNVFSERGYLIQCDPPHAVAPYLGFSTGGSINSPRLLESQIWGHLASAAGGISPGRKDISEIKSAIHLKCDRQTDAIRQFA